MYVDQLGKQSHKLCLECAVQSALESIPTLELGNGPTGTGTEFFIRYLTGQGFLPESDGVGDISFKFEGKQFWLAFEKNDHSHIRLILTLGIEGVSRDSALNATNELNMRFKAMKASVGSNLAGFTYEAFSAPIENAAPLIPRAIRALINMSDDFLQLTGAGAVGGNK